MAGISGRQTAYYICDGVRRAVAAREAGKLDIPARIATPGLPDVIDRVPLDHLHSPKPEIARDFRYVRYSEYPAKVLGTEPPPIAVEPLGLKGQKPVTPLSRVILK